MRALLILALLATSAYGQSLSVTCTKATQGSTATCTGAGGTGPYTYSVSAGSGSINSSSGVYTPPTTVEVKQKVGPCQLLPPDHIYNTRIDGLPVHADSNTIITRGGSSFPIQFQPAFSENILTNATPTFDAVFRYTPSNNGAYQVLDWPHLREQTGLFVGPAEGADRHIVAVNRETCEFSDLYNTYPAGTDIPGLPYCADCTAASGVKYFSDHILPTTGATDAAGMALQPVTLRLSDIQSGTVKHALRFTMANANIQSGASTNYQWPATTGNSTPSCSAPCWKYGMYARLKSSYDISGYSAAAQIILTALKHYGMIMTDGGTNWGVGTSADLGLDEDVRVALREIFASSLRNTDFEVPDTSSMDIASANAAVNLSNGYVTPSQYAEVTVTDAAMATATTRVNLAGITVGTPEVAMTIMAGHTVTPTWWVTGTATQTVTWTMDPDVGTINSTTGEFTPDSRTSPTRTRLTATSTVDATAQAFIDVIVWPDNASGNIYADWGYGDNTSDTYDGKSFWPDEWTRFEAWPPASGEGSGSGDIFTNVQYFLYSDVLAKWYLPNGHYKARIYVKTNDGSGALTSNDFVIHYESQGKLIYRNFPIGRAVGVNWLKENGGYVDVPLDVTDGSATLAFRKTKYDYLLSSTHIAAIAIEADPTDPHLTIDDAGGSDMTIGQTRQFYAIGWYMSDSVTWSVEGGPGTIDANGLYTASSTPPSAGPVTVTIRAISTVDGMIYVDTSFNFVFGTVVVTGPASVGRGQTAQFVASIGGVTYGNVTWSRSGAQGSINSTGLYTAPNSITDATITISASPNDDGGSPGEADLDLVQLIAPIRVDAAWNGLTENGRTWLADPGPCTRTGTSAANSNGGTISVAVPEQETLYDTPRFTTGAGTWGYSCAVPQGVYSITLKWANNSATDLKAKMHVDVEGVRKLTNFEVTTEAGGVLIGVDRTFTAVVTDGTLNLEFVGVSNAPSQTMWTSLGAFEALDLGPVVATNSRLTGTLSGGARLQ